MPIDDEAALAQLLPGRWTVKATNFPAWLGDRRDAIFEYELVRESPLAVVDRVSYVDADGKSKTITGAGKWNGRGFTSRLRGAGKLFATSRWEVAGARQGLLVIRFDESSATPSGVDVLVGEGVEVPALRTLIAADPAAFGLTIEEFASLTWLDHTAG